jgi:hypothetical protein
MMLGKHQPPVYFLQLTDDSSTWKKVFLYTWAYAHGCNVYHVAGESFLVCCGCGKAFFLLLLIAPVCIVCMAGFRGNRWMQLHHNKEHDSNKDMLLLIQGILNSF